MAYQSINNTGGSKSKSTKKGFDPLQGLGFLAENEKQQRLFPNRKFVKKKDLDSSILSDDLQGRIRTSIAEIAEANANDLSFVFNELNEAPESHIHDSGCSCSACGGEDHVHGFITPDLSLLDSENGDDLSDLPTQGGVVDLAKTFDLNSNLNANHTIYLDFDGHTTTDSSWTRFNGDNAIVTKAYDFDGNTASFSDNELTRIQYIWQRVAEDFSPFNVNVTTKDPGVDALTKSGAGDTQWGARIVIGAGTWYGEAGGVAYRSSFNASIDRPAFVFENYLGNGNEKYVAEAISHEAGHTLGLSHDGKGSTTYYGGSGSGATGWAPILGNSYSKQLSQWSKGEYTGATNTQDDLAIITGNNGFDYRVDDHGNTLQSASQVSTDGTQINAAGIIERNTDSDMFSFYTGAGEVSLNLNTAPRGANLDILANLYNAAGSLIATSNPLNALNASFTVGLATGQYFLEVMGTGQGDPENGGYSDYGSLGQYTLEGTVISVASGGDTLSIAAVDADKAEGNSGSQTYSFVVSRSGNTATSTTVEYQVSGVGPDAAASNDFLSGELSTQTLTFAANETSKVIEVQVAGDTAIENDESFAVTLVNPATGTTISNNTATGVIRNDDTPPPPPVTPTVSISPTSITQNEGDAGTVAYRFTVSLDQVTDQVVSVNYETNNGTATLADGDYQDNDGQLTFNPGEALSKTITILVNGDTKVESDESFGVRLTSATNADLGVVNASGIIRNDDEAVQETPSSFVISDVTVSEGSGKAVFTVSRSGNISNIASVDFASSSGGGRKGAKSGTDFIAKQGTLLFATGEATQSIEVDIINDSSAESNEAFYLNLSNASGNSIISDATGKGLILDDDGGSRGGGKPPRKARVFRVTDALLGTDSEEMIVGQQTLIDSQRGTRGHDTFILGDESSSFFAEAGHQDFAMISRFNPRRDVVQLHGSAEDYSFVRGTGKRAGTLLFHENEQDLIAIFRGRSNLSLEQSSFKFV